MSDEKFTLEKLEISKRLGKVETELAVLSATIKQDMETRNQICKQHEKTLYGTNGIAGLKTVVDRLQQKEEARAKHFWFIWTAIGGVIITLIFETLHSYIFRK